MKAKIALGIIFLNLSASGVLAADKIDFSKYMQHSPAISAIASAVDTVSGCSVPLEFEETKEDGVLTLSVHCFGTEDDEMSVVIRFMVDDYSILPLKFDYAG